MTESEKALADFEVQLRLSNPIQFLERDNIETIRKALRGVDECREAFEMTKRLWLRQTDENIKLKSKTQILLKALGEIANGCDTAIGHKAHRAINKFNSDETGVGL